MKLEQGQLFDDIINLKNRVQNLASWVQNDFELMLEDKTFDKAWLLQSIPNIVKDFNKFVADVNALKSRTVDLVSEVINNLDEG